jgi:alkanesulfonate monooxygenase SsuD/methylene tetrahydromethanopterin reductase-like flavin-dependent oxidoreductase (luciferase family)
MFVPQGWRHDLVGIEPAEHWEAMRGLAEFADAGPWESIWVYDHFHTVPVPSDTEATHEAWTLMSAYAATTSRVRLGQMCTCMSYRNPAYLAKVAATVDVISGGRVEMGIGVLGERTHRLPVLGRLDADEIVTPTLGNEHSESHGFHHRFDGRVQRQH